MQRNCRYEPLSAQPLVLVLCQVRFSRIRQMERYIPAIQDAFRRTGFPIERAGKVQQVTFEAGGSAPVQMVEQQRWEYRDREETTSVLVTQDNVILQTTAYTRFEDFAQQLQSAVHTVLAESEHDGFGVVHRVGLRYVDVVVPTAGKDFRFYLRPGLRGMPDDVFLAGTTPPARREQGSDGGRRPPRNDDCPHCSKRPGPFATSRSHGGRAELLTKGGPWRVDHPDRHGSLR